MKNDGGPAFPKIKSISGTEFPNYYTVENYGGMSLRDWFAGMALFTIVSGLNEQVKTTDVSEKAYEIADSMLAEREKEKSKI